MGTLARIWTEAPPLTKKVTYVFVPTGLLLGTLGLIGDSHRWWGDRAFATNLLSSFTGLFFAVPFALLILNYLAEPHAIAAERRAALRLAEDAIAKHKAAKEGLEALCQELAWLDPDLQAPSTDPVAALERVHAAFAPHWLSVEAMNFSWKLLRETVQPRLHENRARLHGSMDLEQYDELRQSTYRDANRFYSAGRDNAPPIEELSQWYALLRFTTHVRIWVLEDH